MGFDRQTHIAAQREGLYEVIAFANPQIFFVDVGTHFLIGVAVSDRDC